MMLFSFRTLIVIFMCLVFISSVASQSLQDELALMPSCSDDCRTRASVNIGCGPTNTTCQCQHQNAVVGTIGQPSPPSLCIIQACGNQNATTARLVFKQVCNLIQSLPGTSTSVSLPSSSSAPLSSDVVSPSSVISTTSSLSSLVTVTVYTTIPTVTQSVVNIPTTSSPQTIASSTPTPALPTSTSSITISSTSSLLIQVSTPNTPTTRSVITTTPTTATNPDKSFPTQSTKVPTSGTITQLRSTNLSSISSSEGTAEAQSTSTAVTSPTILSKTTGLSTAAKVGIGISTFVLTSLLAALAIILIRRNQIRFRNFTNLDANRARTSGAPSDFDFGFVDNKRRSDFESRDSHDRNSASSLQQGRSRPKSRPLIPPLDESILESSSDLNRSNSRARAKAVMSGGNVPDETLKITITPKLAS